MSEVTAADIWVAVLELKKRVGALESGHGSVVSEVNEHDDRLDAVEAHTARLDVTINSNNLWMQGISRQLETLLSHVQALEKKPAYARTDVIHLPAAPDGG